MKTIEDIITYEQQALDNIPTDHPHYAEIVSLLNSQIKDEMETYANSRPNQGAS